MKPTLLYPKSFVVLFSVGWALFAMEDILKRRHYVVDPVGISWIPEWREIQDDQVYDVADKMPRPVGGQDGWESYLAENMRYPNAALHAKTEGVVYVVFILEKDGRTSNVQIMRGIGSGCDEEAKRLVEESPKWNPGENDGELVRVRVRLPIRFHLPN
nr:TonB family protein [Cytophagales bacterium]